MSRFSKRVYYLCEGDTVTYTPTGQLGTVIRIHISNDIYGDKYELRLLDPDIKLWASWAEIELIYPV